jgi:hypothetical protein
MPFLHLPECCSRAMFRLLATADLGHWSTSCRLAHRHTESAVQERQTVLPSLMLLYITAYLQRQTVARLNTASLPISYVLQDLLIPPGKAKVLSRRLNKVVLRPPLLLRPFRMPPNPDKQLDSGRWRTHLKVHAQGHHHGLAGLLSQWHRMDHLLDLAYEDRHLRTLLSTAVLLPGPHLAKLEWETELFDRMQDHDDYLKSLINYPRSGLPPQVRPPADQGQLAERLSPLSSSTVSPIPLTNYAHMYSRQ